MDCPKCHNENPASAKFCNECGAAFNPKLQTSNAIPLREAERKRITALFSDLSGYTAMTTKLDPEEVKEITSRIFDGTRAIVKKYDGFIERFAGDGVLALFGVPMAHEDDSIRAIRAALEIHHFVDSLNPLYEAKVGRALTMHSGVNTGLTVTADVDPEKGTHGVTGEAVNLGARLSDLADAGDILVGAETYRASREQFTFEALKPVKVKGKSEAIPVYKLHSNKVSPSYGSGGRQVFSEMVGRDRELAKLEFHVTNTINGQGSVVNVIGEAGIGKSRLMDELKKRDLMQRVTLLKGRAVSIGKNLSFHPIIDLLKQWARITGDDNEHYAIVKLERAIHATHPAESDEILPFVATLMGLKLQGKHAERVQGIEGEALEKLILKNFRELIIKGSELRPMVIVMEDLHWADKSSLELLHSLYRLSEKHRLLFVNVFRPGYLGEDGDKTTSQAHETIEIQPLADQDGEILINNMLAIKWLPFSFREQILSRAGGNPFFIEEVVRSLIDDGAVVRGGQGFEVTDRIKGVVIPPTITDVLMARIDRLERQTRELIKIASVIGRSFFDRIIKEVADSIDSVDDRLAYLKDVQFIIDRRRMEELEYLFKHALAQEAAYEATLLEQRKALHLKVAQSIEKIFHKRLHEFYGMLAFHYCSAESLERAEACLIKAGEEALKSSASNEALHYYGEALSIYRGLQGGRADPAKVAMLEKNIGLALFNRGLYTEAVEHFEKALNYYWGKLPKNAFSTAFRFLSSFMKFMLALYFPSRRFKKLPTPRDAEVVDLFYKKFEALVVIDPKRFFVQSFFFYDTILHFDLTRFKMGIGIFAGASALFSFTGLSFRIAGRVLDYAKPRLSSDDSKQCIIYDLLETQHYFLKGQWDEIADYDEKLVNRNLKLGETFWASQHYYWHGLPIICQGKFDVASVIVANMSEIADIYENNLSNCLKYLVNVNMLVESRHTEEAIAEVNRGIDLFQRWDLSIPLLDLYSLKASIHLLMKNTEKARKSLDQADQIRSGVRLVPMQSSVFYRSQFGYYLQCLEDSLRDKNGKEVSEYRRNVYKSGKLLIKACKKAAVYRTESYRLMGVHKWLTHDRKGAFKWWNKAIREGESLGAHPQVARTYAEMAMRVCTDKDKSSESDVIRANEFLRKAKTLFSDLGLHNDLEDLNSFIRQTGLEPDET